MNYFNRPEVSNSDLSALKKYWLPSYQVIDIESAYRNGTLIDALITEPERVDLFKRTIQDEYCDYTYSIKEIETAEEMKRSFMRDEFCRLMVQRCEMQKVSVDPKFLIEYEGHKFRLPVRGKWDLFGGASFPIDGDIKSTAATTQKQFEEAIRYFDYQRQGAFYMNIEGRSKFMIIGISKINFKVFKVPIIRGEELFSEGVSSYSEIAFKYWYLFGDLTKYESANKIIDPKGIQVGTF
jgi:hypothetical protein